MLCLAKAHPQPLEHHLQLLGNHIQSLETRWHLLLVERNGMTNGEWRQHKNQAGIKRMPVLPIAAAKTCASIIIILVSTQFYKTLM
jgi:hypothetical protein